MVCVSILMIAGCVPRPARISAVERYQSMLRPEIERPPTAASVGEMLSVVIKLSNTGASPIYACVGRDLKYRFASDASGKSVALETTVDHATCAQPRFQLTPGKAITWTRELTVPDIGEGPAHLTVGISIVDPDSCKSVDRRFAGCSATRLDLPAVPLNIQPGR
jgi:hypothetical protein